MPSSSFTQNLQPILERFYSLRKQKNLPNAVLFQVECLDRKQWAYPLLQSLLCTQSTPEACKNCLSCKLWQQDQHPDVEFLVSNSADHPVKIESVRSLEQRLYLSPQVCQRRIVWIEDLANMTDAASQALLKTLEEPPSSVMFVAMTAMTENILPTILSRFQRWVVPTNIIGQYPLGVDVWLDLVASRYSSQAISYTDSSLQEVLEQINLWIIQKKTAYEVVEALAKKPLLTVLRQLYLIFYQVLSQHFIPGSRDNLPQINSLSDYFELENLFKILDEIEQQLKTVHTRISIQPAVNLEILLQMMRYK